MSERTKRLQSEWTVQLASLRRRLLQRGRSDRKDVDELIQEAFVRLCRYQVAQKAPVRDPVAFLVHAAERAHVDRVRHAVLTRRIFADQRVEELDPVESANTPERAAEVDDLVARIERRLAATDARTRQAFLLHRFGRSSYEDIAERLNISVQAVTNHIAKALLLIDEELARQ